MLLALVTGKAQTVAWVGSVIFVSLWEGPERCILARMEGQAPGETAAVQSGRRHSRATWAGPWPLSAPVWSSGAPSSVMSWVSPSFGELDIPPLPCGPVGRLDTHTDSAVCVREPCEPCAELA